jgi:hypothetical protein
MDHAFKVLVTAALAIVAIAIITSLLYFGFFIFSAVRLENQTPQRQVLIDTLFHGARIRYEKLEKAHLGYTGHQYLLVFNNQYVWSAGERIEPNFRGTQHYLLPVFPEDLKQVVAIRHLTALSPRPSSSSPDEVMQYVTSTLMGTVMWLSPNDITRKEFELIGNFIEHHCENAVANSTPPLFYVSALVYADESLFAPRVYVQKTSKGERTITIHLNGEASYHQNVPAEGVFGQPFGQLDSTAQVLRVQLAPELGMIQPLNLTKEEIESFVDAQGQALRAHYKVEIQH